MNNKKVASLGLALTMVVNAVPALATETQAPHDIETHKTDDVMGTDAHVCDTQEIAKDESASCNVYAEVGSEFTVTIPKSLTLSGADKTGAYDVTVEGDIAGDQYVSVVPDAQFAMVQDGKADVTATITQEITKFRGDDYKDALAEGEAKFADGAEGAIDAQGLTAGAWNGTFNFNIALEEGTEDDEPVALEPGLYDANGIMLCTWEESGIDTEIDYVTSYNDPLNFQTAKTSGHYVLKFIYPNTAKIVLPEEITFIGNYTFYQCKNLISIEIPENVTRIGDRAFAGCTNLSSIEIPESVTSIEECAFYNCTSLTNIEIPNSVTSIGKNAFYDVPHITYNGTATGSPWGALAIN